MIRTLLRWAGVLGIAGFLLIQLVPYGRAHTNPPVTAEPAWDSARTRDLTAAACFDCHSNETRWPWYANFAPASWLLQRDVDEGRRELNFSAWDRPQEEADDAVETIVDGDMPPRRYLLAHPEARLSDEDRDALLRGLQATLGGGEPEDEDDD